MDSRTGGDRGSLLRIVLSWAHATGALVEEREQSIVVRLMGEDMAFTVSFASDDHQAKGASAESANAAKAAAADLAAAINSGRLTREIDAAVGWDPELAV